MTAPSLFDEEQPVCECARCWAANRDNDPKAWPTIPPWHTWSQGTIRVAIPCLVRTPLGFLRDIDITSECEFFGHSLNEARRAARLHLRDAKHCPIASEHNTMLIWPNGSIERYP
jgi:hypothetical protein